MDAESPEETPKASSPGTKEREFYKYYEPRNFGLQFEAAEEASRASPDKALTAFCQLGALRLNARRSFISFFDRKYQYILAEATRTCDLQDGASESPEDALWKGVTIIPRGSGICSTTLDIETIMQNDVDVTVAIINDLMQDERFQGMTEVARGQARFYAGVPIKSPFGHSIGSFCIVDDKPREGLSGPEIAFLKDVATMIMVHFDRTQAADASTKGERMIRGLGSFIEGNYSPQDWWMQQSSANSSRKPSIEAIPEDDEHWSEKQYASQHHRLQSARSGDRRRSSLAAYPQTSKTSISGSAKRSSRSTSDTSIDPGSAVADKHHTTNQQQDLVSSDVKAVFSRAAAIIKEVLVVEETIFFDASIGSFGGLVDEPSGDSQQDQDRDQSDHSRGDATTTNESASEQDGSGIEGVTPDASKTRRVDKPCEVLGFAAPNKCSLDGQLSSIESANMTEGFLRLLLKRYPRGKVFTFDVETNTEGKHQFQQAQDSASNARSRADEKRRKRKSLQMSKSEESDTLRSIFPGVRSLSIVPLYDTASGRWFAGAFSWTADPMRVLSNELDLRYLAAFGDSIMAEVSRLDAKKADTAKATMLSSISHELRSPLHGILGSVECLQDTEIDTFQTSLVHTVETCGKVLLDTIENLLDFAKINNYMTSGNDSHQGRTKKPRATRRSQDPSAPAGKPMSSFSYDVDVDLSVIAEETMDSVFAGHDFARVDRSSKSTTDQSVSASLVRDPQNPRNVSSSEKGGTRSGRLIIVDIDKASESHWVFRSQAGAWRRVLMNLFGNALKYTDDGFIKVTLRAIPLPKKQKGGRSTVQLEVSDSGRGMSKEYLEHQLFQPFAQENSLAPGTGLGLSIVKQIVNSLGGHVEVESKQGEGTKVKVTVVMVHAPKTAEDLEETVIATTQDKTQGLNIGFVGFEADSFASKPNDEERSPDNARYYFMHSFHKLCKNWFGMEMHAYKEFEEDKADVYLVTEHGAGLISQRVSRHRKDGDHETLRRLEATPVIVLCDAASAAHARLQSQNDHQDLQIIEYISQPCGPKKLARSLSLCLERVANLSDEKGRRLHDKEQRHHAQGYQELKENAGEEVQTSQEPSDRSAESTRHVSQERKDSPRSLAVGRQRPIVIPSRSTSNEAGSQAQSSPNSPLSPKTAPSNGPQTTQGPQYRILLVDDNHINMQLLENFMKKQKHSWATATNGLEAFEAYKSAVNEGQQRSHTPSTADSSKEGQRSPSDSSAPASPFDYILMDLSMPVMNGLESTRKIRAHEKEKGFKGRHRATIIALTGVATATAQQEAYSSGIDMFLTKPVRLKELTKILDERARGKGEDGGSASSTATSTGPPKGDEKRDASSSSTETKADEKADENDDEGSTAPVYESDGTSDQNRNTSDQGGGTGAGAETEAEAKADKTEGEKKEAAGEGGITFHDQAAAISGME